MQYLVSYKDSSKPDLISVNHGSINMLKEIADITRMKNKKPIDTIKVNNAPFFNAKEIADVLSLSVTDLIDLGFDISYRGKKLTSKDLIVK